MEAETLKRKKTTINKGKIKKTIKNVICRPDPIAWPLATTEETEEIKLLLNKYSVPIPKFKKLPWKELKLIPKNERPKQPTALKVSGLIFGMSECRSSLNVKKISALLVESTINPRTIIQPIIADCVLSNIPVLCLQDLKNICSNNFGIPTSCLGIQECLKDLVDKIKDISLRSQAKVVNDKVETETNDIKEVTTENKMDIDTDKNVTAFSYLYRTSKKFRVFVPNNSQENKIKEFGGQHFIKFSEPAPENHSESKKFKKMIVKRIANNPNRVKVKNK